MESTRVDLISLHLTDRADPVLAVQNHEYDILPIHPGTRLLSCQEASQTDDNNISVIAIKVVTVNPRIREVPVKVERTKLVVENLVDSEIVDMFVMGMYSANMDRLGVAEGDLALISGALVSKTRVQPKQDRPTLWSIFVGLELFRKKDPSCQVRFVRSRCVHYKELQLPTDQLPQNCLGAMEFDVASTSRAIILDICENVLVGTDPSKIPDDEGETPQVSGDKVSCGNCKLPEEDPVLSGIESGSNAAPMVPSKIVTVPIKPPHNKTQKVFHLPLPKNYEYTDLKQCSSHKSRYNTWAVINQVVELPTRRKTKLVARLLVSDESLEKWCNLSETYKFSVLANSMENMPPLDVGSILRIHHMVVEVFNGVADGRVYDARGMVVVEGGVGEDIRPISTKDCTQELVWSYTDVERVKQLRKFYAESFVCDLKLEEIVKEVVMNLSCVLIKIMEVDEAIVLRVADGTEMKVSSLVWTDKGEQEQSDQKFGFVDVLVKNFEVVDMVRQRQVHVGSYMRLTGLRCELKKSVFTDSERRDMEHVDLQSNRFEFVLENSRQLSVALEILHNGDSRVDAIKERMREGDVFDETDIDINALFNKSVRLPSCQESYFESRKMSVDSLDILDLALQTPSRKRKMSPGSLNSLDLALGMSASPPCTPKHSGLATPIMPITFSASSQDNVLGYNHQSDGSVTSFAAFPTMLDLISSQRSTSTTFGPNCLGASGTRKMNRKRAKIKRSAEEVDGTSTEAFKDVKEDNKSQVSNESSQGLSQFKALGAPVRQRNEQILEK